MLPRDFNQACWLFRLLDKNLAPEQNNVNEATENSGTVLETIPEANDPGESNQVNADDDYNNNNGVDAMCAEDAVPFVNEIQETPMENSADDKDVEDITVLELTDDCEIDEPQITPLDPEAVEKVLSLLVDRTVSMTLSQVEDVGIALSALSVKCYGQDVNQVLAVYFLLANHRFCTTSPVKYSVRVSFSELEIQRL